MVLLHSGLGSPRLAVSQGRWGMEENSRHPGAHTAGCSHLSLVLSQQHNPPIDNVLLLTPVLQKQGLPQMLRDVRDSTPS